MQSRTGCEGSFISLENSHLVAAPSAYTKIGGQHMRVGLLLLTACATSLKSWGFMQQDVVKLADNDSDPELRVCVGRKE